MSRVWWCALALLVTLAAPAAARSVDRYSELRPEVPDLSLEQPVSGGNNLSSHIFADTVSYGGTFWNPDSLRWEAIRDSHWSFDSGVGSFINDGSNPNKPVGYHQQMEGWVGIDQSLDQNPYFQRSSTCAIDSSYSLWAGVTLDEANALCFASGQGYGNNWYLTVSKSFTYGGTGNVAFSFDYAVEAEPTFDYAYAFIDTTGNGSQPDILLWSQTGVASGNQAITLNPGQHLRSNAGGYTLKFVAFADGGYSDEDGAYTTTCGLVALDNVTVGADVSDFEADANGWVLEFPLTAVGDYSDIRHLGDLTPPAVFCPCGLADSVLVFFDTNDGHPLDQDNLAMSPWIDLVAGGDAGRPGKLMLYDVYAVMPITNYIFVQLFARYYPEVCALTGLLHRTPWRNQNLVFYYGEAPFCNPVTAPRLRDYSGVILSGAEQVQIAVGVINLCRTAPFGDPCSGITNQTPYLDNISLGVYGNASVPSVLTTTFDRFQDNFASDGTPNPTSPGRLDQNRVKGASTPSPGSILGDTLVARGNGGNVEVRLVFRARPGPFVNAALLATYTARWTSEPALNSRYGGTWYSARMDTAEQAGVSSSGIWMATFHESDPGFSGTDRTADPNDRNRLANDIIPDHLFTPGSRLDYFVAAHYLPPDPRNPGGLAWGTDPDTSGARFREAEILPSSMAADTTWNCVLYVDHHDDRDAADQKLEEAGLQQSLGPGGNNAEGTRYDRFDVQTPASAQMSFGRPLSTNYGASQTQVFSYKAIAWHSAALQTGVVTAEDVGILNTWLWLRASGFNNFWGSGDGIMQSMQASGGIVRSFMNNTLGVLQNCTGIRQANCGGTAVDTTYCIPMSGVAGSWFASSVMPRGRGNGCPNPLAFDRLSVNGAVSSARGQLNYVRLVPGTGGVPTDIGFASVTNFNTVDVTFKTVLDGISVGRLRTNAGYHAEGCNDVSASLARTDDVCDWFGAASICRPPRPWWDAVPEPLDPPQPFRHALGAAYPNPMSPATRIRFTNGVADGPVRLEVFDVTGRLVRRVLDARMPAGVHEVAWDGTAEDGTAVAGGLYFYRLTADGFTAARKLIVSN